MSAQKKPSERLLDILAPLMEREGYAYRKTNHRFIKSFPFGTNEYSVTFDGRGGLVGVSSGFFVHFSALEEHFKNALGYVCPWSAGATLLNAGAKPWKYWLFDSQFAAKQPSERKGIASDVIHPQAQIEAGVRYLLDAHLKYAVPLFQRVQTIRQYVDFISQYFRNGRTDRCRPMPETGVYLWLLAASANGDDLNEIVENAKGIKSHYVGHDVNANVQKLLQYVANNK